MSYAHEGVWAGAGLEAEDSQPTTEAVEPPPIGPSTGGFSDAGLDALTPEELQVAIENDRINKPAVQRCRGNSPGE